MKFATTRHNRSSFKVANHFILRRFSLMLLLSILILGMDSVAQQLDTIPKMDSVTQIQETLLVATKSTPPVLQSRHDTLVNLRSRMLIALKENQPDSFRVAWQQGDSIFAGYLWYNSQEEFLGHLFMGQPEHILASFQLRQIAMPPFCPEQFALAHNTKHSQKDVDEFPDLFAQLIAWYTGNQTREQSKILQSKTPDLAAMLELADCDWHSGYDERLQIFAKQYPNSVLSKNIVRNISISEDTSHWSGNGFIFSAGPNFILYDSRTRKVIPPGVGASISADASFPYLKFGVDFLMREFTPRQNYDIGVVTVAKDRRGSLYHTILRFGTSYPLWKDLYVSGWTGIVRSSLNPVSGVGDEVYQHSWGIPAEITLDWLPAHYSEPSTTDMLLGTGFRFAATYLYHRLGASSSSFGYDGLNLEAKFLFCWGGNTNP